MIRSRASKILTAKRDGLRCSRLFFGFVLLVLGGIFTPAEAQAASGYSYRVEVDFVDAEVSGGSHTNFPVLISSTLPDLRTVGNGGKVENANGYDIIFTDDEAGTNQLAHEIESYVSSTGEIIFWVRVESLAATTKIYMFYGNSGISTFQGDVTSSGVTGVWDNNYLGVWHLTEDGDGTTGEFKDASGNTNHATGGSGAFPSQNASGGIHNSQTFDGTNDHIDGPAINSGHTTISGWAKTSSSNKQDTVTNAGDSATLRLVEGADAGAEPAFTVKVGGSWYTSASGAGTKYDGSWHYLVGTYDGETATIYFDGVAGTPDTTPSGNLATQGAIHIGIHANGTSNSANGDIDEVRMSDTVRTNSADWI